MLEERRPAAPEGDPGAFGATKIVNTDDLFERLEKHQDESVDARAFLTARLVDLFLGDWDRHQDQWRWSRPADARAEPWVPIPRDRDQAFARFDGLLLSLARLSVPQLVEFSPTYPSMVGLTWNARVLDRRLLKRTRVAGLGFGRDGAPGSAHGFGHRRRGRSPPARVQGQQCGLARRRARTPPGRAAGRGAPLLRPAGRRSRRLCQRPGGARRGDPRGAGCARSRHPPRRGQEAGPARPPEVRRGDTKEIRLYSATATTPCGPGGRPAPRLASSAAAGTTG